MNDDLMTAVRAEFAQIRMTVAADTIMSRGRGMQRRRHSQIAASALAVAVGVGLGIPALTSEGSATGTALSAWTVTTQPGGAINVTIRELRALPALQAKLTEDGARVAVGIASTTAGAGLTSVTPSTGCQVGPANPAPTPAAVIFHSAQTGYYFTIQPTKIPAGDMVRIAITTGGADGLPGAPVLPALFALLVHDSPGCGF
jgi:hypothetical protein